MSQEIAAFKAELDAAGLPWSRLGIRAIGVGLAGCMFTLIGASYVAFLFQTRIFFFAASLAVIAAGWVFMIAAMLKRRAWARSQPLRTPPLSDAGLPGAQ